jgi:ubiquinone/menaquinone biosynthesis C-methylase UbiE
MEHNEKIIEQFSLQAIPFSELAGHSDSLQMLIEFSEVSDTDSVLDVACGPGIVACKFAEYAAHITGIDITPKMIEQAKNRQQEKNLTNTSWEIGNVMPLPFPDSHFSLVITRYSFHHFLDPMAVMSEMVRVCKPGGKVMVVDLMLPPDKVDAFNHMEKLRDPSHTKALCSNEMAAIIGGTGLEGIKTERYKVNMELEAQLAASFPNPGDDEKLRQMFSSDIGQDLMGIGTRRVGGEIHFSYPILVTVGRKVA